MNFVHVFILSITQGLAELLPVSSSAHVIVMEKLMGLDPSAPEMTFLLVMLHTGTMFAVIAYFWKRWLQLFRNRQMLVWVLLSTLATAVVGYGLKTFIEHFILGGGSKAEIELLFSNTRLLAAALASAGLLILFSSLRRDQTARAMDNATAIVIGAVQGLCLPFRGFSRSGATISTALIRGVEQRFAEEFSFILAVVLTPPVVGRELLRLLHARHESGGIDLQALLLPGLTGMVLSFGAGWLAITWLSSWLEKGRWHWFGVYCLALASILGVGQIFGLL